MPYRLAYFSEAVNDIIEAKKWYYSQLPGLEKRFAKDIKNAIIKLKTTPFVHAIRHRNIRIAHPIVFPYSIHYYVDEFAKRIVIIGIVHNSRQADFLNTRSPD